MILYSFLGASQNLQPVTYAWNGKTHSSAFSCMACARFLDPAPEEIVIFETAAGTSRHELLEPELQAAGYAYHFVPIKNGENERELWEIFQTIVDEFPEQASIAFDVTNGFRFYPILGVLAGSFMETIKHIRLAHMFYGAFEAAPMDAPKPMFDLSPMLELLKWTAAADRFTHYGDSTDLAGMLMELADRYSFVDPLNYSLIQMSGDLGEISDNYQMLRPEDAHQKTGNLRSHTQEVEQGLQDDPYGKPLALLLEKIKNYYILNREPITDDSGNDPVCNRLRYQRHMIARYLDFKQYMQAVSLANEWLTTWVMNWLGMDTASTVKYKCRNEVNQVLNTYAKPFGDRSRLWFDSIDEFTEEDIQRFIPPDEFYRLFKDLHTVRNDMDHAGQDFKADKASDLKDSIENLLRQLMRLPLKDEVNTKC